MRGQRGWRELAILGDKINKISGMLEGMIWSPRSSESNRQLDEWTIEEVTTVFPVGLQSKQVFVFFYSSLEYFL